MSVRAVAVLATAVTLITACAGPDAGNGPPTEAKSRAEVEAVIRTEVDALAVLAGSSVTNWAAETSACDIADPGRAWAMSGSADIPLPPDKHVETVRAIRDRWFRADWQLGDSRVTPDASLPDTVTGSLTAGHPDAGYNVSVTSRSSHDHLALGFGARCYQPVEGEDPANG